MDSPQTKFLLKSFDLFTLTINSHALLPADVPAGSRHLLKSTLLKMSQLDETQVQNETLLPRTKTSSCDEKHPNKNLDHLELAIKCR